MSGTNNHSLAYSYGSFEDLYSSLEATLQPAESVPEPGTILGLVAVGAGLVSSKRKKQG
ncbi:PEP-CTERM sorting domain-containing protein [Crocosphaera sp.]|uniref:PEP-CTERM sorting domain-containing protein n=1 Tax=Crocosphaera sp. TaxID=2729996 RepID=UPI0026197E5B|nr:PEP-CTERM sorting domain-containing protein [Crocosphaera sp.]MDJ0582750.1 PEP-CTERM sorting domain-containing protein [Crocosphaera sp.]